jgi:hypothetical protein
MKKHSGGRPQKRAATVEAVAEPATLSQLGISTHESHRWQQLAKIPPDQFDGYVTECYECRRELTTAGALAIARRLLREEADCDSRPSSKESQLADYEKCKRAISYLIWLEPLALVSAMGRERRTRELEDLSRLDAWVTEMRAALTGSGGISPGAQRPGASTS